MLHEPEFLDETTTARQQKSQARAREMARCYARLFASADGQSVLEDLRTKFSHERSRFVSVGGRVDSLRAAVIDGQCDVLREIERAIRSGAVATD